MKRKNSQNINGISISDSIVMSVKRKNANFRKPFSAIIAVIGFVSVLMSFLGMFSLHYNKRTVVIAAFGFTAFYLTLSVIGGKSMWIYAASVGAFAVFSYKKISAIALGFKFVYNIIYKASYHVDIEYYKNIKASLEVSSVTTLIVSYLWLLAIVIYYFTICRPNPILPLMVTFPLLELGMYNGIEVPILWGMLCIAYWLAVLAMSTIDVGEYSGGQSGFVRKNNLFFPKRHMKLKVTEKCGIFIVASVMLVTALSYGYLKAVHYKRSEKLNEKRRDITEAMDNFSFENLAESLSNLSNAFGLDFEYENHKLGNNDHVRYKNITDLTVTIEDPSEKAIYLKRNYEKENFSHAIYKNNEWFDLPSSAYKDKIFDDFKTYDIYPQDFPELMSMMLQNAQREKRIWIKNSQRKTRQIFAPYGTINKGELTYDRDHSVSVKDSKKGEASYTYVPIDVNSFRDEVTEINRTKNNLRELYSFSSISDSKWRTKIQQYCTENDLLSFENYFTLDYSIPTSSEFLSNEGKTLMAALLQNEYKEFVYDNYLDVPNTKAMKEVEENYADILSGDTSTLEGRIAVLDAIRNRMDENCTYSLTPRKTPSNRDFVNYFLLENHKGFCTHFATAGVMLARMAGIPARYATGYIIVEQDIDSGKWNYDNTVTIDVKDNHSHAWAEVYLDGIGWVLYEFTAAYVSQELNTNEPQETTTSTTTVSDETTTVTAASKTTKNAASTSTAVHTSTTTQVTNTVTSISGGIHIGKGGKAIPKAVKNILLLLLLIILAVIIIWLRRYLILKNRNTKFNSGKLSSRVRYMYSYAEKLLSSLQLNSENGNYKAFAKEIEDKLSGDYFEAGSFEKFTDIALRSSYGQGVPDQEEIKLCKKIIDDISAKLYNDSNAIQKLKLMFINVLK